LNRSILAQGWGQFETMLAYKLEAAGGTLCRVDPVNTSQTCAACGVIDRLSRKSQAAFACVHCGHADHADRNAAIEILRRSTAGVEGAHVSLPLKREPLAD
jgi:putative transposase